MNLETYLLSMKPMIECSGEEESFLDKMTVRTRRSWVSTSMIYSSKPLKPRSLRQCRSATFYTSSLAVLEAFQDVNPSYPLQSPVEHHILFIWLGFDVQITCTTIVAEGGGGAQPGKRVTMWVCGAANNNLVYVEFATTRWTITLAIYQRLCSTVFRNDAVHCLERMFTFFSAGPSRSYYHL